MKETALLLAALGLAACAPQAAATPDKVAASDSTSPASLDSASIEVRSWGKLLHRWTVGEGGKVEHVADPAPFGSPPQPLGVRRVTLDAARLAALGIALDRVALIAARPAQCAQGVTDMPYGKLSWARGGKAQSLDWQSGCLDGRDADLWRAIKEADSIVDGAAMATRPVETLPDEGGGKGR